MRDGWPVGEDVGMAVTDQVFYARASGRFAVARAVRAAQRRGWNRTPEAVLEEYDQERQAFRERFAASDWTLEDYVRGDINIELNEGYYFAKVIDGQLQWGLDPALEVSDLVHERLLAAVDRYQAKSVLEVGCGTGRNMLFLKSQRPEVEVSGLEISPASVAVAAEAAERFGLAATFEVQDVLEPWTREPVDLVVSVHALEQIPRGASDVVRRMQAAARAAVVVWEPLPDLLKGMPRVAAELRIRHLDRLPAGAFDELDVTERHLLPKGAALNRTTEVHFAPGVR